MIEKKVTNSPRIVEGDRVKGSQATMQALKDNGTRVIFGYPGGAIMPTYDALYDFPDSLRHILVRHEQGATHMAEGYFEVTGEPGVVMVTSGPGATNAVTGAADALMDSRAMVLIPGQVARPFIGTQAFQEAPVIDIFRPVTKWVYQVQNAAEIPTVIDQAFAKAKSGRPGPVLIDIPKDVQNEETVYIRVNLNGKYDHPPLNSDRLTQLQNASDLLNNATKPFILAGHGVLLSNAERQLLEMAEKAGIPVANTLLGLSSFPANHDLFAGMLGMHGRLGANVNTNEADVILAVGMRFDDRVTGRLEDYAKQAKIIHIDIDPSQLNRLVRAELAVNLDAKTALSVLLQKVETNNHAEWLDTFKKFDEIEAQEVRNAALSGNTENTRMAEVIDAISRKTAGEAVIVADVGQNQMVAAQYYEAKKPRSFITSGGMGTMGFALPAALGAKIGAPEKQTIAITGDGGVQMTIQELGTIAQENTPVKIVVLNNSYLGMVRQWQKLFHDGRYSFVKMRNPDFARIASEYGIPGETVANRRDQNAAIDRMLYAKGPHLLNVIVEREDDVFPMIPTGAAVNEIRLK